MSVSFNRHRLRLRDSVSKVDIGDAAKSRYDEEKWKFATGLAVLVSSKVHITPSLSTSKLQEHVAMSMVCACSQSSRANSMELECTCMKSAGLHALAGMAHSHRLNVLAKTMEKVGLDCRRVIRFAALTSFIGLLCTYMRLSHMCLHIMQYPSYNPCNVYNQAYAELQVM